MELLIYSIFRFIEFLTYNTIFKRIPRKVGRMSRIIFLDYAIYTKNATNNQVLKQIREPILFAAFLIY